MEKEPKPLPNDIVARTVLLHLTHGEYTSYQLMKSIGPNYEDMAVGPFGIHRSLFELHSAGLIERRSGEVEVRGEIRPTRYYRLTDAGVEMAYSSGIMNEEEYVAYTHFREQDPYEPE